MSSDRKDEVSFPFHQGMNIAPFYSSFSQELHRSVLTVDGKTRDMNPVPMEVSVVKWSISDSIAVILRNCWKGAELDSGYEMYNILPSENTRPPKDSLRLKATTRDPRQRYRSMNIDAHDTTILLKGFGAETRIGGALKTVGSVGGSSRSVCSGSCLYFIPTTRALLATTANSQIILWSVQSWIGGMSEQQ